MPSLFFSCDMKIICLDCNHILEKIRSYMSIFVYDFNEYGSVCTVLLHKT
jgi:hypothetical protein